MTAILASYFSLSGRLSLSAFRRVWLRLAILMVVAVVAGIVISMQGLPLAGYAAAAAVILTLLSTYAVFVRRLHDRGLSGWFAVFSLAVSALAPFIENSSSPPISLLLAALALTQVWLFFETFFRRGKVGPNRYGADPFA